MSEFLYKSKNAIVVYKPAGVPSQPDKSGDGDIMSMASSELSSLGENKTLFLIHRLDRVVGGLLIFARNKQTAARLSALVSGDGIGKIYLAAVPGAPGEGVMKDYLYKDAAQSKSFVVERVRSGVKEAELEYRTLETVNTEKGDVSLVLIKLKTGRFHQIRTQFSSRGMPIIGDGKYGSRDKASRFPALFSARIEVSLERENISVTRLPDIDYYPWNLFKKESYDF